MRKTKVLAFSLAAALSWPLPIKVDAGTKNIGSDPSALMEIALENPSTSYQGQMMVSYWTESGSKAEEVKIYFTPPNNYRFEFLAPNGTVERVVMSKGPREQVQVISNNQVIESFTTEPRQTRITPEEEKNLLRTNYKPALRPSETVLGRPTWSIELIPLVAGKPHQLMRIDQATHVILEIKRFLPEGKTGSLTQFTKFEPVPKLASSLFLSEQGLVPSSVNKDGLEIANKDDLTTANGAAAPEKLNGGFSLAGGDQFEVSGKIVKQLRYTDGLLPVSIFQTPLPVKAPAQPHQMIEWSRPIQMGTSSAGNIFQWQRDKQYYTLIGDAQQELLQQIAGTLR